MIKIVGHRVLVKQEELEDTDPFYKSAKEAGFVLAKHRDVDIERKTVDKGVVVQIGQNAWAGFDDGHPWCKVGDMVQWVRHAGYLVKDPATDEEYVVINDEDIVCITGEK